MYFNMHSLILCDLSFANDSGGRLLLLGHPHYFIKLYCSMLSDIEAICDLNDCEWQTKYGESERDNCLRSR